MPSGLDRLAKSAEARRGELPGTRLVPVRPSRAFVVGGVGAAGLAWLGLVALVGVGRAPEWLGLPPLFVALSFVAAAIVPPLLFVSWTPAVVSRLLLAEIGARGDVVRLRYLVPGRDGGAWLSLDRPRLLLSTARTLLVWTRWGPRLLPRFVSRGGREQALVVTGEGFVLEDVTAPRVRVADAREVRVASPASPTCVECGDLVTADLAVCGQCTDAVHDGPCASKHTARHEGAAGGRAYR